MLTDRNLEERYEQFMRGEQDNRYMRSRRGTVNCVPEEAPLGDSLPCRCSDATVVVSAKKREIQRGFIRNAAGQVYLPGSSVKGAIRTALLLEKMQEELPEKDEDQRKRVLASRKREKEIPEGRYLNLLELRTRDGKVLDDAVNSIMRGLQISDSLPVPDSQMMLSKKVDVNQDGEAHTITCVRECIRPEVELHLKLTLDQSVCKGSITKDSLLANAADSLADDYYGDICGEV
ncbi:MAG: type III-A CRISPR-associated RAMP protein Csm5 [Oscillospiraceae bacterium]